MREYRYHLDKGEIATIVETEVADFKCRLHETINRYHCTTGNAPTHLVLGRQQQALWAAMIHFAELRGEIRADQSLPKKERRFCGCLILTATDQDSLIAAVEADEAVADGKGDRTKFGWMEKREQEVSQYHCTKCGEIFQFASDKNGTPKTHRSLVRCAAGQHE